MATIGQTAPTTDSVLIGNSGFYSNQLAASGAVAPITWTVTVPNAGLVVTPAGIVTTTGVLAVGPYTVSGTMVDSAHNTGIWSFTLTVKETLAPQTTVTPSAPISPLGIEMAVPFQIDPATGGVAVLTDYNQILAQHLLTILMTAPGERVMRPTYGFGMERRVFDPIYVRTPGVLQPDIEQQLKAHEPGVDILSVDIVQDANNPNVLDITISYSVLPSNTVNQVSVTIGGSVGVSQVIAQ